MLKERTRKEKLAFSIGLALTAGMLPGVPVVFGAPVADTNFHANNVNGVVAGNAAINQTATAADTAKKDTAITSDTANNVLAWKDFSVRTGEAVNFDDKNYMNIVTSQNTSTIDGKMSGTGDIYLINPSGVIINKGAEVNVGNLTVSTRYVDPSTYANKDMRASDALTGVLANNVSSLAMDVVNLGTVSARNVTVEGNNIRFLDSGKVTADAVNMKAGGYIHVGNAAGTDAGYTGTALDGTTAKTVDYYTLIGSTDADTVSGETFTNAVTTNRAGNYMLASDVTDATMISGTFTGKLDGMYHTVSGTFTGSTAGASHSGLFSILSGADIRNLGITNSTSTAGGANASSASAGVLAGTATGTSTAKTTISNVWSVGNKVTGTSNGTVYESGLVGGTTGYVDIDHSYVDMTGGSFANTGYENRGAFIGSVDGPSGTINVDDSYAIVPNSELIGYKEQNDSHLNITNFYAAPVTASSTWTFVIAPPQGNHNNTVTRNVFGDNGAKSTTASAYLEGGTSLSGGLSTTGATVTPVKDSDSNPTGSTTRDTWRIYEGQSTPYLTSMMQGIKTVNYDFQYYGADTTTGGTVTGKDYTAQDTTYTNANIYGGSATRANGTNKGADISALVYSASSHTLQDGLVYNGDYLKIVSSDGTAADGTNIASAVTFADGSAYDGTLNYSQDGGVYGQKAATSTKALLYTDQQGYDIVGGNIAIAKRQVNATISVPDLKVIKEYDGTTDAGAAAAEAIKKTFQVSAADLTTGIVAGDSDAPQVAPTVTATYSEKDVHSLKTGDVNLSGTINLTGGANNYTLIGSTGTATNSTTVSGTAQGAIYQKTITLNSTLSGQNKTYDGDAIVKDSSGNAVNIDAQNTDGSYTYFTMSGKVVNGDKGADNTEVTSDDSVDLSVAKGSDGNAYGYYVNSQADTTHNKNAGTHTIQYGGISITGTDAKNYVLKDGDGKTIYSLNDVIDSTTGKAQTDQPVTAGATGSFFSSGKINLRRLGTTGYYNDKDGVTTNGTATRQYDGSVNYAPALGKTIKTDSNGILAGDTLTFTVGSSESDAQFVEAERSNDPMKNVGDAHYVRYNVNVSGDDAQNYTFDDPASSNAKSLADISTATVYGKGDITPRTLYLTASSTTTPSKTYDGNATVYSADDAHTRGTSAAPLTFDDGYISYADSDASHHLVSGDSDKITYTGAYQSTDGEGAANVNWDSTTNAAKNKNVSYDVHVTLADGTTASSNYKIVNGTTPSGQETTTATISGTGIINPKNLTNVKFATVTKAYDTTADLGGTADATGTANQNNVTYALTQGTADGIVNGETLADIFDADQIKGTYGQVMADGFTANSHVHRLASDGKTYLTGDTDDDKLHDMRYVYSGTTTDGTLTDALKNHNYSIDASSFATGGTYSNGVYTEEKAGSITPTQITAVDLVQKNPITKVYDGTTAIATKVTDTANGDYNTAYTGDYTGFIDTANSKLTLASGVQVSLDDYKKDNTYGYRVINTDNLKPTYDSKNVADNDGETKNVTFYLDIDDTGDAALADSLKSGVDSYNLNTANSKLTGTITPRQLNYTVTDGNNKTYNADADAENVADYLKYTDANDTAHQVIEADKDKVTLSGSYLTTSPSGKTTTAAKNVLLDDDGTVLDKNIRYTVNRTGNAASNYTVKYANDGSIGTGKITQAPLTLSIADMHKVYDGTDALGTIASRNPSATDNDEIRVNAATLNTVLSSGSSIDNVDIDRDALMKSKYDSADQGTGKSITWNLKLIGSDRQNYYIANPDGSRATDGLGVSNQTFKTTNNTIGTKKLTDADVKASFKTITKVYDGSDLLTYNHSAWQNGQGGDSAIMTEAGLSSYISKFILGFSDLTSGQYTVNGTSKYTSTNAGSQTAYFDITLDDAVTKNYDLSGLSSSLYSNGVFHLTATPGTNGNATGVSITPQNVYVSVDTSKNLQKVYDGMNTFQNVVQVNSDGTTTAVSGPGDVVNILAGTTKLADGTSLISANPVSATFGKYATGDVRTDSAGNAIAQDVKYTVNLGNANYNVYTGTLASPSTTYIAGDKDTNLAGEGTITPKIISAITLGKVSKTYDATANLPSDGTTVADAVEGGSSGDLVGGQKLSDVIDASKLSGTYGSMTNGTFTASPDVVRDSSGNVVVNGKDVRYTVNSGTLDDALRKTNSWNTSNYKFGGDYAGKSYIDQEKSGTIQPKSLDLSTAFTVNWNAANPVTKVYDGSDDVTYDHSSWISQNTATSGAEKPKADAADSVSSLTLSDGIASQPINLAYSVDSADYNTPDTTATTATYTFGITDADTLKTLNNYKLNEGAGKSYNATSHTFTASTSGTITPQEVKVSVNGDVTKVYNGKTDVVTNSQDNVVGTAKTVNELLTFKSSDGTTFTNAKNPSATLTSAAYDNQNVVNHTITQNSDGSVVVTPDTHTVTYTTTLNNANFKAVDATDSTKTAAGNAALTIIGNGTITPKDVTVNRNTTKAGNKDYDTTAAVNKDGTGFVINFDGTVGSDTINIKGTEAAKNALTVNYTPSSRGEGAADVNRLADNSVGSKGMQFSDIDKAVALANPNYTTTETTVSFADADEKGKINPVALTLHDIKADWSDLTRQYDGTTQVADSTNNEKKLMKLQTTVGNTTINLKYGLADASKANFSQADAGDNLDVTYELSGFSNQYEMGNFKIDTDILNGTQWKLSTAQAAGETAKASITPKLLSFSQTTPIDRTYDGTTTIDSDLWDGKIAFTDAPLTKDTGVTTSITDVSYDSAAATADPGGTLPRARKVSYTGNIGGDTKNNYTLYTTAGTVTDTNGNTIAATTNGIISGVADQHMRTKDDGTGDILRRIVYADVADVTGLDKTYDGKSVVSDSDLSKIKNAITLDKTLNTADNTGVIGTDDVGLDTSKTTANYVDDSGNPDKNVEVDAAGNAVAKDVYITGWNKKTGTSAANYLIKLAAGAPQTADGSTIVGSGRVTPKDVHVMLNDTTEKIYDGTPDVRDFVTTGGTLHNYKTGNISITAGDITSTGDTVDDMGFDWTRDSETSPRYFTSYYTKDGAKTSDVGTGLGVNYDIGWTNNNYNLVLDTTNAAASGDPAQTITASTYAGGKHSVTLGTTGSILPRLLDASVAKAADKTYDGTTDVKNPLDNLAFTTDTSNGYNVGDTYDGDNGGNLSTAANATATGTYDGADAVGDAGSQIHHSVDYAYTLGNSNFQLAKPVDAADPMTGTITSAADYTGPNGDFNRIDKRKVYVDFTTGQKATVADKTYDGANNTDAEIDEDSYLRLLPVDTGAETGILSTETDGVNLTGTEADYADGNVARNADGSVATKDVTFSGMELTGDKAKNYTLLAADDAVADGYGSNVGGTPTLTAAGQIDPRRLAVSTTGKNAKVYDGTTDVYAGEIPTSSTYADNDGRTNITGGSSSLAAAGLTVDTDDVVAGDDLAVSLTDAKYVGAHRNSGANAGKEGDDLDVDYGLTYNQNYDLVADTDGDGDISDETTGTTQNVNGSTLRFGNGRIAARLLTVNPTKTPEKTYDGTTLLPGLTSTALSNADSYLSTSNLVNGDDAGLTATGSYDSPDAADSIGVKNSPRTVTYGLAVGNDDYQAPTMVTGAGQIDRFAITVQPDDKTIRDGDPMPDFTGRLGTADGSSVPGGLTAGSFTYGLAVPDTATTAGSRYPIYAYYGSDTPLRYGDNVGLNYTLSESDAQKKLAESPSAFQYQYPSNPVGVFEKQVLDPGHLYHEAIQSEYTTPDRYVYTHTSRDHTSDYERTPGADYAVEYPSGDIGNGVDYAALAKDSTVAADLASGDKTDTSKDTQNTGLQNKGVINLTGGDAMSDEEILEAIAGGEL